MLAGFLTPVVTVIGSVTILVLLIEKPWIVTNLAALVRNVFTNLAGTATGRGAPAPVGGSTGAL